ncbi:MAG: radical SAM protein [Lachnospiraceae bacterium]|nr:radical SAM protein [Lachnospiraceae bacterium]
MKDREIAEKMKHCTLCPRKCGVDRNAGQIGYCKMPAELMAARASLHMWEEPCISGEEGSGTVFFSGCNMGCVFCQNGTIADGTVAKPLSIERLSEIFLELQGKGANNINLVTPTHYMPQIKAALVLAKEKGLTLPVLYNSSGYESVESLSELEGLVDIYLPDMKYVSPELSAKYSGARDYFRCAKEALKEMVRQIPAPEFDDRGMMKKGVIVRHLALPECITDSKRVLRYLHQNFGERIYISIMNQYTPMKEFADMPELNRTLTQEEYDEIIDYALELGIEQGFIQEGETAKESFIPLFDYEGL